MTRKDFLALPLTALVASKDAEYLADQARRLVAMVRFPPGRACAKGTNTTRHAMYIPSGNLGYPAMWVRDAVMMYGAGLVPAGDVEDFVRLVAGTINGPAAWKVREGVEVPPFAVPDHVLFDGRPCFYPGSMDSGVKQGGPPFGKYPPLDDAYYFIEAVDEHRRLTGKPSLFLSEVETRAGRRVLADLCRDVYEHAPADPETRLAVAGDPDRENAKDWGFCDVVFKSGLLLFPSILRYRAAARLSALNAAAGRKAESRRYAREAAAIRASIAPVFLHETWLHSATGVGNQPDVWGSAFAVWSGVLDPPVAERVARALARAYRERTAVVDGCVRHILTSDGSWERVAPRVAAGEYQNGAYWGTPVGWYIAAVARVDRAPAARMLAEFVAFLRREADPQGASRAWECFSTVSGKKQNDYYVATAALPYIVLREAGLLK